MSRAGDEKATKVYLRCEACGKITVPGPEGELPSGWIAVGPSTGYNAARAVCSTECQAKLKG